LNVQSQDWESLTTVLGGQFSFSSSQKFGVVIPEGRIGWVHEFKNSSQQMKATYVDDPLQHVLLSQSDQPDRDYFELGLGVSTVLQGGLQLMFNYDTVLGFSNLTDHLFTIGARQEL
jgi:outer membrane autotransporter protein